jgi:transcriptional regulator with XRE-family HTH domain
MAIRQPVAVIDYLCKTDPYKCACGDTFGGLALLKTHLDLLRDDGTHAELERVHRGYRPKLRICSCDFYVCSCGAAFSVVSRLDEHLDESRDGSHGKLPFNLNKLVRFGIRRIRIERGLSMHAMADLLGVNISAVSRIESGKRHAVGWGRTPRTVATLLGVEVRELIRVCEHCGYRPPAGCRCMRCGTLSTGIDDNFPGWQQQNLREAARTESALRAVKAGDAVITESSESEL